MPGSANPRLTAEGQEFLDEIDESVNWDYGLLEADRRRKRRNKVMLGVAASLVVLAGVGVGGWYLDKEGIIDVPFELDVTEVVEDVKDVLGLGGVTGVGGAQGAAGDPGGFIEGPYPPEGSDEFGYADDMWEGQTVYDYSMISGEGRVIPVTETVEFGPGGLCETSTIRASFDTEEEALSFVDNVHATYGADLIDAVAEGFEAVVTVDVSANALTPEGYEQALSATVEDLVVIESY